MPTRVLVVDDERDVLRLIETILSDGGYEVVSANGADEAVRAFEEMAQPPDLILTDVVMPGMSGPMLINRLRPLAPDVPVLFMSGYDHSQVVQQYVVQQGFDLIAKPFNGRSLQAAIKKVWDVRNSEVQARRWFVHGRVQGVGFRYFVAKHATALGVQGWVRNEDDGRVHVYAVGTPAQLRTLAGHLHQGPVYAEVRGVEEQEAPVQQLGSFRSE